MPVTYIKLYKDGAWQKVEQDRVERFLELGWAKDQEDKSHYGSKEKIVAVAEVTSSESEELEQECPNCGGDHAYEACEEDNWTYSEDELPNKEEN